MFCFSLISVFTSIPEAARALRWTDLNPRQALYYGLIPSIIILGHKGQLISEKCQAAIQKCVDDGLVTEDNGVCLLKSFITGQASLVPRPLLVLMNTVEEGKVHWIPCHMMVVLKEFAYRGSLPNQHLVLENIVSQGGHTLGNISVRNTLRAEMLPSVWPYVACCVQHAT